MDEVKLTNRLRVVQRIRRWREHVPILNCFIRVAKKSRMLFPERQVTEEGSVRGYFNDKFVTKNWDHIGSPPCLLSRDCIAQDS